MVRTPPFHGGNTGSTPVRTAIQVIMENLYYLHIGKASDLKKPFDRFIYRFFEMLPGMLVWATFIGCIVFSKFFPRGIAIAIITFDAYWLFRSVYFSTYLKGGFNNMKKHQQTDWTARLKKEFPDRWEKIYHLLVMPMFKEPYEVVRDSMEAILKINYPKDKFIVVIPYEEGGGKEAEEVAERIEKEYKDKFFKFMITMHPRGIAGELAGKASNETWGTKKAKEEIIDNLDIPIENIIFSSFDADTVVYPGYFSCLTHYYLSSPSPTRCSYQPIPLFINNIWEASPISRVFAFLTTFWQMMSQERPGKLITFSSHSMSFKALVDVGYKQVNVISDDSRIFWQCFLRYDGDYRVQPIYYPISMDSNVGKNLWESLQNIYKQQRRWAYGVTDIPYFLFGCLKNKKLPSRRKNELIWEVMEGHWSWASASFLIFVLGWMPILLGGPEFTNKLLAYNLPLITSQILTFSMVGLMASAYYSLMLTPPQTGTKNQLFQKGLFFVQWLVVPIVMIFFSALPSVDAQTRLMLGKYMGFWFTPKSRKE